jgi:hypothetical protein
MAWKLFSTLNAIVWMRGVWRLFGAGHFPGFLALVGIAIGGVASVGLYAYAHQMSLGASKRFWTAFFPVFIVWSLLSVVSMVAASGVVLHRPMGGAAVAGAVLFALTYIYFQATALFRQTELAGG